jgi:hypothetical protein
MIYNKHIKRVIIVWIYYILLCIITLRFLLLAIVNESWIWILFADPIYVMKKPNSMALCVAIFGIYLMIIKTVIIYIEESPQFRPIIQLYFCNRNHYGLRNRCYRKLILSEVKIYDEMPFGTIFQVYCLFVNHSLCRSNNQSLFRFRFRVPNHELILSLIVIHNWLDHCFAGVMAGLSFSI